MGGWSGCGCLASVRLRLLMVLVDPCHPGWLAVLRLIHRGRRAVSRLENYARMIKRKSYFRIFVTTFEVSLLTTGICILIGYPLAYFCRNCPAVWPTCA